jgi:Xaa-Pro dipeptidase
MRESGVEQIIVTQPQSIFYLTGQWVNPMDRLDALIITQTSWKFLCYILAVAQIERCETVIYSDMGQAIPELCRLLADIPTGVDEEMPSRYSLALQAARPALQIRPVSCVEEARMIKDAAEIPKMENASHITDLVFEDAFSSLREGMTELDVGQAFSRQFERHGVGRFHGDPMVAFGAGAADPHHGPGGARLRHGDCVMVDTGKRIDGYYSDTTRTVFFGACSAEQRLVYEVVLEANRAAIDVIRPGIDFREIDKAARAVIERAGYGEYFTHKTCHGVGIDFHERPTDRTDAAYILQEGMAFSVEPGIYLPGRFGIRIEDLAIVARDGAHIVTHCPKELRIVAPRAGAEARA